VIELVIEAMVDAVVVVDAEGLITLANAGAEHLSGFSRDELRGMNVARLLNDDSSGIRTVVRKRIADGKVLRRQESWIQPKEGERIPVSVTGSAVIDDQGVLKGIVVVARDTREIRDLLSELHAAKQDIETKLEETRHMMLLAERRATLGTLAGGVGHELRNIAQIQVAAVDEITTALEAKEDLTALARTLLPELQRVADHITLHGTKLMQLARPGPDHVAPIDLNTVVRDVAAMLRLAGKLGRVELVLALEPTYVTITVNRSRIEQILVNLVTNAVDAIGDLNAGRVTITVRSTPTHAICTVSDTGGGIPAAIRDQIFDPFFTTKGPEKGTGLGLPVVRDIVDSYGGTLHIESAPGKGTTFTFELPR
jgi:PAS domain S-box-containing protein